MNAPTRKSTFTPTKAERLDTDDVCDICCAVPVADVIDGDRMCFECADKWVRAQRPDDDLVPISTLQAMGLLPVRGLS